jgi:AraC-like DNA-binding protein
MIDFDHSVDYLGTGHHRHTRTWLLGHQVHPHHELIVVRDGIEAAEVDGKRSTAGPGDLLLFRAGSLHREWSEKLPMETLYVGFRCDALPPETPVLFNDTRSRVSVMAGWLNEERKHPTPHSPAICDNLIRSIMAECLTLWTAPDDNLVAKVRRYINSRLTERLTLAQLADHVGMSQYHFSRRYRELSGRTPVSDVRVMRLERARDLILTTDLPMKEIAPISGLQDVYHMSRLFRRCMGITPSSLRRHQ